MADILDEVLNDAKDEKRLLLFRAALPKVIGFAIIMSIIIALYNWHQYSKSVHNQNMGDLFLGLVSGEYQDKKLADEAVAKIIEKADNGEVELLKLSLIGSKIASKDINGAMQDLEALASSKDVRQLTSSYARIAWLNLLLDQDKISDVQQSKARDYFQYFTDEKQPFFSSSNLLQALFYQKNGQYDLAKEYANKVLVLERAPLIVKEQAKAVLSLLSQKLS